MSRKAKKFTEKCDCGYVTSNMGIGPHQGQTSCWTAGRETIDPEVGEAVTKLRNSRNLTWAKAWETWEANNQPDTAVTEDTGGDVAALIKVTTEVVELELKVKALIAHRDSLASDMVEKLRRNA